MALDEKVATLASPELYAEQSGWVETIETHMSWVFLTPRYAFKLKKPIRMGSRDLATVEARRWHCREEVRLNRRLAPDVYLGTRALTRDPGSARLELDGPGSAVDYLVWMRRLPADGMLDWHLRHGDLQAPQLEALAARLAAFHRALPPEPLSMTAYRRRFLRTIRGTRDELAVPASGLDPAPIRRLAWHQYGYVLERAHLFDQRVREQRIAEGHGDLRPEHVCFERRPVIIDCLEFSRDLRVLDGMDELAFLVLECERLGAAGTGQRLLAAYAAAADDPVSPGLVHFYQSYRATIRALLAIRHNTLGLGRDPARWLQRARHYLALAEEHIERAHRTPEPPTP